LKIETERLILFPLTVEQLQLLISNLAEFEKSTSCYYEGETLTGEMYSIFKGQIDPIRESRKDLFWLSFWMIALKESCTIIGSIGFKGAPTDAGSVEIGYGVNPKYERNGYATEAARAMVFWAFHQSNVIEVIAEVDKDNLASQRVLQKNGLQKFKSIENFDWYCISK